MTQRLPIVKNIVMIHSFWHLKQVAYSSLKNISLIIIYLIDDFCSSTVVGEEINKMKFLEGNQQVI